MTDHPPAPSPCCAEPTTATITGQRCTQCHRLITVVSLGGGIVVSYPSDARAFLRDWNARALARDNKGRR